jgi:hypothetical protein
VAIGAPKMTNGITSKKTLDFGLQKMTTLPRKNIKISRRMMKGMQNPQTFRIMKNIMAEPTF